MNNFFKLNYELAINEALFKERIITTEQYKAAKQKIMKKINKIEQDDYELL